MFGLKEKDIEAINSCFERFKSIDFVIIYGSRANNSYKNGSDIDLTIIGNDLNYQQLLKLENNLDDLLLPYKIDISIKNNITNPDLIAHIENVGKVFYDRTTKLVLHEPAIEYKMKMKGNE